MKLSCMECGKERSLTDPVWRCECGGLLQIEQSLGALDGEKLRHVFDKRLAERNTPYASGVWRYKELIHPELPMEGIVTKYEGNTGLYGSEPVRRFTGVRDLRLKAQSENPSGSFKDNGMTVAVSQGAWLGYERFACSSTGNTSSSLAMYAALSGKASYVFVPEEGVADGKVLQTAAYGARMIRFQGTYDDGIRFLEGHAAELEMYVCNSINPFRIEGQKSIVYEIAQALNWTLPDWIVLPGGALSNGSALGKGLRDMVATGLISRMPRVAIVQAEGASPFHRMIEHGLKELVPEPRPHTLASALNIGNPPSWKKAADVLRATRGVTVSVTDEEIMEAKAVIDRAGIGCEPASAASAAGLRKLVAQGIVDKDETAVCILTGHMLKDTDALQRYVTRAADDAGIPVSSALELGQVKERL
ncbi:threonine synthase [Paenibacillus elgii]|uniref:Threonine synthase n=1 Tax=Paenibacillus elgii TaxID=189691 RepID=A0A2T6FUN2_9BACL|nr:threonine synthase [Paenibacillus elgii]PUA35619.1 threonine synthase [Paenibacillus elgii]